MTRNGTGAHPDGGSRGAGPLTTTVEACLPCRSGLHGNHGDWTQCRCPHCEKEGFINVDAHHPDCRHRLGDACRPVRHLRGLTRWGRRGVLEAALAIALEQEREAPQGIEDGESGGWGALADGLRGALEAWEC